MLKATPVDNPSSRLSFHLSAQVAGAGPTTPSWFRKFEDVTASSRWFQPYLRYTDHRSWIVRDQHQTLGRITAINPIDGPARFGFFNCINKHEVAQALTEAAETWLRSRGVQHLIGPFNPSIHEASGLLERAESPIQFGFPDTQPYLINLLEGCGYIKSKRLLTYRQTDRSMALRLEDRMDPILKGLADQAIKLELAQWGSFHCHCSWLRDLINQGWGQNWGFEPISLGEAKQLLLRILTFLPPGSLCFTTRDGLPIGIALGMPDARSVAAQLPEWLGLLNLPLLLHRLRRGHSPHFRVALLGIIPELQGTPISLGSTLAMLKNLIKLAMSWGATSADMGWILDDNTAMLRFLSLYGGNCVMSHVIMGKQL